MKGGPDLAKSDTDEHVFVEIVRIHPGTEE